MQSSGRSSERASGWVALLLCALLVAGCSRAGTVPTVPAAGNLLLGEEPLAGVTVLFSPAVGRPAYAVTDTAGRFTLSTFVRGDGAVAGSHRVTLAVQDPDRPEPGTPEARGYKPPPSPFAKKYGSMDTSDLEIVVPPSGSRSLTLRVER